MYSKKKIPLILAMLFTVSGFFTHATTFSVNNGPQPLNGNSSEIQQKIKSEVLVRENLQSKSVLDVRNLVLTSSTEPSLAESPEEEKPSQVSLLERLIDLENRNKNKLLPRNPLLGLGSFEAVSSFMESHLWEEQSLASRLTLQKKQKSFFGEVYEKLFFSSLNKSEFDDQWFVYTLDEIEHRIESKETTERQNIELYFVIDLLLNYYHKNTTVIHVDRDGEEIIPGEEKKVPQQKEEKPNSQIEQELQYEEMPDDYMVHTKNTENNSGETSVKKTSYVTANFITQYFAQKYYYHIQVNEKERTTEILSSDIYRSEEKVREGESDEYIIVKLLGNTEVTLFLPDDFVPLAPRRGNSRIQRNKSGSYTLFSTENEVFIPVKKREKVVFDPIILARLIESTGLSVDKLPLKVKNIIARLQGKSDLEIAKGIQNHLKYEYLYSVGKSEEKTPLEALEAGKFQCDFAATIMVSILRDVFNIPCRVVSGKRAVMDVKGQSHVVVPSESHGWVEVYIDGKWYTLDPTPKTKDKKTEEETDENSEFFEVPDNDSGQGAEENENNVEKLVRPKNKDKAKDEDDGTPIEGLHDKNKEEEEKKDQDRNGILDIQELINKLEIGSLRLNQEIKTNPFDTRIRRVLLKFLADPRKSLNSVLSRISFYTSFFQGSRFSDVFRGMQTARSLVKGSLLEEIHEISSMMFTEDINKTYFKVFYLRNYLLEYVSLLDASENIEELKKLIMILQKLLLKLQSYSNLNAFDIGIVKEFTQSLPSVLESHLYHKYGFLNAGNNQATLKIAKDLKSGKLDSFILLKNLLKYADFIQDSTPRQTQMEVKTFLKNENLPVGRDLLTATQFNDVGRGIRLDPGRSILRNLIDGKIYIPSTKQAVSFPSSHGLDDAERVTIVLFDTSGSMRGDPEKFQAALIAAFVSIALSDPNHKVVLLGFDEDVHFTKVIKNKDDFFGFISEFMTLLKSSNGGTDIMAGFTQTFALIADAQTEAGEPLSLANIIVMTDGQVTNLKYDELMNMRNAIDGRTPIQILNVAINGTNPELKKFAEDSTAAGFEKGYYFEFLEKEISQIIAESSYSEEDYSDSLKTFFSEKKAEEMNDLEIRPFIYDLLKYGRTSAEELNAIYKSNSVPYWQSQLGLYSHSTVSNVNSDLQMWINSLRTFTMSVAQKLSSKNTKERDIMQFIAHDILVNFRGLSGVELSDLSAHEMEELRQFLRSIEQVH